MDIMALLTSCYCMVYKTSRSIFFKILYHEKMSLFNIHVDFLIQFQIN